MLSSSSMAAGVVAGLMSAVTGGDVAPWLNEHSRSVRIPLPDRSTVSLVRDRLEWFTPDSYSFVGRGKLDRGTTAIVAVRRGIVTGVVRLASGAFRLRGHVSGPLVVEPVGRDASAPRAPLAMDAESAGARTVSGPDDGSVIDLLVAYTPRARRASGGKDPVESLVQLGVSEANLALRASGTGTRLRLVYLGEVDYEETFDVEGDLELLQRSSDGAADEVHRLRERHRADVVQLIVEQDDGCGIAYQLSERTLGFQAWAFSVVERKCIVEGVGVAHELGHTLGSDHAPEDPTTSGAFPFSHGHKDFAAGFRTIMAYGPGRRVPRFSNPKLTLGDQPLGDAESDNARSIRLTRETVAQFRPSLPDPVMVRPRPGENVRGPTWRFEWALAGTRVDASRLWIGTRPGSADILDSGVLHGRSSFAARGVDRVHGPVFVRLWYRRGASWLHDDWSYRAVEGR